ncbi:heterogeneous nuclear ribonucleoproteins A2/B1-like [Artemia franciscana]|uniref:heterogeneous nuclear ribonucleoproteins A2/B1-like n=1 Tax=Artemia franciscana TaxID=6661 RepID=UPI0032DB5A94
MYFVLLFLVLSSVACVSPQSLPLVAASANDGDNALYQNGGMGLINIQVQKINNIDQDITNNNAQANIDLGSGSATTSTGIVQNAANSAIQENLPNGNYNQGSGNFGGQPGFNYPGAFHGNRFNGYHNGGYGRPGYSPGYGGYNQYGNGYGGYPQRPHGGLGGIGSLVVSHLAPHIHDHFHGHRNSMHPMGWF